MYVVLCAAVLVARRPSRAQCRTWLPRRGGAQWHTAAAHWHCVMPDDIDDFFAELDAVADQVQQEVASACAPAPVPTPTPADFITVPAPASDNTSAATASSGLLDDFFGGRPASAAETDTCTTAPAETLTEFFGGGTSISSIAPAQHAGNVAPELSSTVASDTAEVPGAATATATPVDRAEADMLDDTSSVMRHTLLLSLSLCRLPTCDTVARSASGEAVLGPGSWCKIVLQLNEPRQTVELQSWQLLPFAADGTDASESSAGTVAESVLLSFWKGRSPPELKLTLWFTSHDADNSIHPDDDGAIVAYHRGGTQIVALERLPLFASTVLPVDDLSQVLRASVSVSVRPTDCDILPDPDTKHSRRDDWGFSVELCNPAPTPTGAQTESESLGRDHRKSMQWQRALRRATQAERSGADGAQQRECRRELRRICCAGVPSPHRGYAWYVLSGAREKALASGSTERTSAGGFDSGSANDQSEYRAKLAEAREEIAWYANGGAARLRAKTRATVHGGARLCGAASGPVGTYTAAMIRQYTPEDDQPEDSEHFSISDFGMRFHASDTFEVVVSSVVPGSPAEHAGEVLQHLCET